MAVSPPKPRASSPSKQVLKRSHALLAVPSTSRPFSNAGNGGNSQNRGKHPENKLPPAAVYAHIERPTALKKLQKRQREGKNRRARVGITPEERERLLTRYRSLLKEQATHRITPPQILLSEVQKRKRRTGLKAGIIRDRIARRAFRLLLQQQHQQQQMPEPGEEPSDQVQITAPVEIMPPKVVVVFLFSFCLS